MNSLIDKIIRDALGRQPTHADYVELNQMLSSMPPGMRDSPTMIWDLVVRMDQLQQFKAVTAEASLEAQRRIHKDLQPRIDEAAYAALRKIRLEMPIDLQEGSRRLVRAVAIAALVLAVVAFGAGFIWAHIADRKDRERHHAASEVELGRCVDAATGAFANSVRSGVRASPITNDQVRNDRDCQDFHVWAGG